jgi:hypothetical protein
MKVTYFTQEMAERANRGFSADIRRRSANVLENGRNAGAPGEIRTHDLRFRKPLTVSRSWRQTAVFCLVISALVRSWTAISRFQGSPRTLGLQLRPAGQQSDEARHNAIGARNG